VLEDLRIEAFDLEKHGGQYGVRAQAPALKKGPVRTKIKALLYRLQDRYLGAQAGVQQIPLSRASLQLHYTPQDIDRLDFEYQIRSLTDGKKPDPFSLPEMLRIVGSYVDRKGRLVKLSKHGQHLTIHYLTDRGETRIEDHDVVSFYDLSVHLYLKRSNRRS
jgi:hypothetical protein